MTDYDISHHRERQQYEYREKDKTNISIKRTTGHHTQNVTQRDIVQASTSVYQEEYVPPVDTPLLEPSDPNASNEPPKNRPLKPGAQFRSNFETLLRQLPLGTLKSLASSPHEARAMLRFAHANPEIPMDPKVRAILNSLVSQAAQETREDMDLSSNWQPPEPNAGEFNARIGDHLDSKFESLLKENFSGSEFKSLRLAYYHPQYQSRLSPELQSQLNEMKNAAYAETQSDMGFPEGWQPPADSSALDDVVNGHFTRTFDELVAKLKELSPRERKELRTLFRFPNAKVPDREKLQELLQSLTQKAQASAKERFGLPDDYNLSHQANIFKLSIKGGFGNNFQREVLKKLRNGEINNEQAQKLLASKGTDPAKLPTNLQNVYTQARQTASKQTATEFGLPDNWQPAEESSETADSSKTAPGETSATPQETVRNADGTVRVRANTAVKRKNVKTQQSQPIDPMTAPASNRDQALTFKAINYYQQAVAATSKYTAEYFTGPEQMHMTDSMATVSEALSNLRETAYAIQVAEARASREVTRGQNDAQEEKIRKELKDMMKAPPKQFFLFKILRVLPVIKNLAAKIEGAIKILLWAVDVVLGGALNMITQAIGMQPITENPFAMWGWINEEQAKKMDLALGIIVMVAEMAISTVLAQPQLVMAQVSAMTSKIATVGTKVAAEAVKSAVDDAVKAAVQSAAKTGGRVVAREVVTTLVEETTEKLLPKLLEQTAHQTLKVSAKQASKQAINQTIRLQAKAFVRKVFEKAKEIAKAEVKQQIKRVQNYKQNVSKLIDDPIGTIQQQVKNEVQEFGDYFKFGSGKGKGVNRIDDGVKAVDNAAVDAGESTANQARQGGHVKKSVNKKPSTSQQSNTAGNVGENADNAAQSASNQATKTTKTTKETTENAAKNLDEGVEEAVEEQVDDMVKSNVDEASTNATPDPDAPEGPKSPNENLNTTQSKQSKKTPEESGKKTPEEDGGSAEGATKDVGENLTPDEQLKMDASKLAKFKEDYTASLKDALERAIEKELKQKKYEIGKDIGQDASRQGLKDTLEQATKGKEGFDKFAEGLKAGKNWVETEVKDAATKAAKATKLDKVADEVGEQVDKVTNKIDEKVTSKLEKTKVGKVAINIAERFSSSETLIKQASKLMQEGTEESLKQAQRKLLKASAKRMVERQQANFRFMMDIKNYIQDTIQFASYTAQTIMHMKKADAAMKAAENQAFIQEMDAYIETDKKAVEALLKGMEEMAGWINDINQQESTFWKKMEIRFIAA